MLPRIRNCLGIIIIIIIIIYQLSGLLSKTSLVKTFIHSHSVVVYIASLIFSISRGPHRVRCIIVGSHNLFLNNLCPCFIFPTSMSYTCSLIVQAFFHPVIVVLFLKLDHPYHLNVFCCTSVITSPIASLSVKLLPANLSVTVIPHRHLILIYVCIYLFI